MVHSCDCGSGESLVPLPSHSGRPSTSKAGDPGIIRLSREKEGEREGEREMGVREGGERERERGGGDRDRDRQRQRQT